ncbi:MAG: hypothetical protein H0T89_07855, partial [Deltaproteobacteria bacterium]|nr:hypothetical protein [Deltaproteobacteria bacterium]
MRLRTLSELLIATALASCKSGPPVTTVPPDEPPADAMPAETAAEATVQTTQGTTATPSTPSASGDARAVTTVDVAPEHPHAKWRWVSIVELVRTLAPPAPDARGVYVRLVQPGGTWQWGLVAGLPITEWCAGQVTECPLHKVAPTTGLVTLMASGEVREATYAPLRAGRARRAAALGKRAADDPELRAFDHLFGKRAVPSANGVFIVRNGTGGNAVPAELAMARVAVLPAPAGMPLPIGRPVIATDVALRLKEVRDPSIHAQGVAAVEAMLAKLPSEERAVARALYHLSAHLTDGVVQVSRLSRGWFVEIMPEPPMSACSGGARPGMHAVVVLGEHVDVVHNESAVGGHCRGRRPPGFALAAPRDADPIARFYAEAAQLEAASVDAFEMLADELAHHGAPAALIERTRAAARDELRHAAVMATRAHAAGAIVEVRA